MNLDEHRLEAEPFELDAGLAEVEQETNWEPRCLQIVEALGGECSVDLFDGFEFDNNCV